MRRVVFLWIALWVALGTGMEAQAAPSSLSVSTATITINATKFDQFVITGTFSGLTLQGGGVLVFGVGWFSQEIEFKQFTQQDQQYTYNGTPGDPGLAQLVLDVGLGQFTAIGANLELGSLGNPLTVRLEAGTFQRCTMIHQQQAGTQWTFNAPSDSQHACQMPDSPQATPRGVLVGKPMAVRV
jgi:hypothetical protein